VTLCLPVHGCDTVNGGAVELSWKLRPASSGLSEKFVDCDPGSDEQGRGSVTQIRLRWTVPVGDTVTEGAESWRCQDNHGATGFTLPEGTADLSVTPMCGTASAVTEAAPNTYISPATVQRLVTRGDTVSLGAVELVVSASNCRNAPDAGVDAQPCVCDGP
jgi:hypothetical protein